MKSVRLDLIQSNQSQTGSDNQSQIINQSLMSSRVSPLKIAQSTGKKVIEDNVN